MNTEIAIINENTIQLFQQAPDTLRANTESQTKAVAAAQLLKEKVIANGMSPELDEEINGLLVKLKNTYTKMNDRRKPITQIMDEVKKAFTTLEADIDSKSKTNIYAELLGYRSQWATYLAEEKAKREAEAQRKLDMEKEFINLKTELERQLMDFLNQITAAAKSNLNKAFESTTLETIGSLNDYINQFSHDCGTEFLKAFKPSLSFKYAEQRDELLKYFEELKSAKLPSFSNHFTGAIKEQKAALLDRVESKRNELVMLEKAKGEELEKLKKQQEERRQAEEKILADEAEAKRKSDEAAIAAKAEEGKMQALFNKEAEVATTQPEPEARAGYEIIIKHQLAYMQIFQFYFEKEGKSEMIDKLDKKTLGSMKTFCENYAHKFGEKIDSQYLEYKQSFKAVVRK